MADVAYRIGEPVAPRSVSAPARTSLPGRTVTLVPLDPEAHAAALFDQFQGPGADPHLWDYLPYGPFADVEDLTTTLRRFAAGDDPLFFTILDGSSGRPLGFGSYLRIDPANRVIEIGHLCFGAAMQRSTGATEAIYLLIRHAFALGYRRVEWKCDALNERSTRAAARFGFTYEGTFRQAVIVKGRNRDTAWLAIIDRDWPAIDRAFQDWLAPDNFDDAGIHRRRLAMPNK